MNILSPPKSASPLKSAMIFDNIFFLEKTLRQSLSLIRNGENDSNKIQSLSLIRNDMLDSYDIQSLSIIPNDIVNWFSEQSLTLIRNG